MLQKVSLRMDDKLLKQADHLIDNIFIKNRSQAIQHLLRKAVGREKIAVILSKGQDHPNQNLKQDITLENKEFNIIAKLPNGKTLIEEQVALLRREEFTTIFIITLPEVITKIKSKLKNQTGIEFVENPKKLRTLDALKLIKDKVNSDFLVFYGHNYPNIDLSGIFDLHTRNNYFLTLNLTWGGPEALSYIEMDGHQVTTFEERSKRQAHLTYNAVFVAHPNLLEENGHSVVYDVFPKLAKKGLVHGFITKRRLPWIKSVKDKEKIVNALLDY